MKMSRRLEFWLSLGFILAIVTIVYYPTLSHLLRGESYLYFVETMDDTSLSAMLKNWWNYESARTIAPGDTMMFRPLLFISLAFEKVYFGLDYFWWRLVAMLIHLTTVACLFRLLWKFKPGILATLMAILFGTSYLALSTMLYEQIATYSLFTGLLLTGFYYTYQGTEHGGKKNLIIASLSMLVASFFHESGVVFTVLFIMYFWWERKRLGSMWKYWGGAFGALVFIWIATYIPVKFINPPRFLADESERLFRWRAISATLRGFWALADRWLQQAVIPAMFVVRPLRELAFHSYTIYRDISLSLPLIANFLAIGMMGVTYLYTQGKDAIHRVRGSFIAFLATCIVVFMLANSALRTFTHGESYLIDHNFNMYIWLALSAVFVYILISTRRLNRIFTLIVAGVLIVLIGLNAPVSLSINLDTIKTQEPIEQYFYAVDDFIEEHQNESDFSFNILATLKMQEQLEFFYWKVPEGMSNQPTKANILEDYDTYFSSVTEVVYAEYWDNENPKYTLEYDIENSRLEVE